MRVLDGLFSFERMWIDLIRRLGAPRFPQQGDRSKASEQHEMALLNGLERGTAAEGKVHVKNTQRDKMIIQNMYRALYRKKIVRCNGLFVNLQVTASVTVTHDRYICLVINSCQK